MCLLTSQQVNECLIRKVSPLRACGLTYMTVGLFAFCFTKRKTKRSICERWFWIWKAGFCVVLWHQGDLFFFFSNAGTEFYFLRESEKSHTHCILPTFSTPQNKNTRLFCVCEDLPLSAFIPGAWNNPQPPVFISFSANNIWNLMKKKKDTHFN